MAFTIRGPLWSSSIFDSYQPWKNNNESYLHQTILGPLPNPFFYGTFFKGWHQWQPTLINTLDYTNHTPSVYWEIQDKKIMGLWLWPQSKLCQYLTRCLHRVRFSKMQLTSLPPVPSSKWGVVPGGFSQCVFHQKWGEVPRGFAGNLFHYIYIEPFCLANMFIWDYFDLLELLDDIWGSSNFVRP